MIASGGSPGPFATAAVARGSSGLPRTPGRSSEAMIDGEVEIRFAARPTSRPQVPRVHDEFYIVAAGGGRYRVDGRVHDVGPGNLLFATAQAQHGFEDISEDFPVRVMFYGPRKQAGPAICNLRRLRRV